MRYKIVALTVKDGWFLVPDGYRLHSVVEYQSARIAPGDEPRVIVCVEMTV